MNQDENIVNILMKMANPEMYNKNFDDIVINSTLYHENSVTQMNKIVSEFNMRDGSIVVKSSFGKRIQPNEFRLVSLNQECEIVPPTLYPMRKRVYVNINNKVEELGICKQTDLFIGNYGSYIVNVPLGKIALAWKGNNPSADVVAYMNKYYPPDWTYADFAAQFHADLYGKHRQIYSFFLPLTILSSCRSK